MAKFNVTALVKGLRSSISKHSPEILTGLGIAGMVGTVVMAVRATPRAMELIDEKCLDEKVDKLTPIETVKVAWRPYVPAAITGATSIVCLIGASSVNAKRNAALAAAYTISDTALREYREKVIETVGEKKEKVIRDEVAKDRLEKSQSNPSTVIVTGTGSTVCYDVITKQRFTSNIDKIRKIENELNKRMLSGDDYISLNDFYYELGLDSVAIGDELGWNVNSGLIDLEFSAQLDSDGTPCIVIDYRVAPVRGYSTYSYT